MCGICGFVGKFKSLQPSADTKDFVDNKFFYDKIIKEMTDEIAHRGPDEANFFIDDSIAMGFRRLSIIDLSTGSQPIFNENHTLVLTFNGEIYNHLELRSELISLGHKFYTNTDSEVIIHAYEQWHAECLTKFRGMFAFSLWDMPKKELFLARDCFGIKPLNYYIAEGNLIYGSEIKSILKHPNFVKNFNYKTLDRYLSFQYASTEETFFEGVYSLPPGCYMIFKQGDYSINRYFNIEFHPDENLDIKTTVNSIRSVLDDSINAHKISDVEVGCFLSGGVDSSIIASYFKGHKSFTVGFAEKGNYNEVLKAQNFSQVAKLQHFAKIIGPDEFWDAVPIVQYYMDQPLADPSCVGLYFVSKLASEHVKVVLSGEGADEFFGGYKIYKEPDSFRIYHKIFPKKMRSLLSNFVQNIPFKFKGKNFIIRGEQSVEEKFIGNAFIFSKKEKEKILNNKKIPISSPVNITRFFYNKVKNMEDITKMQYIDINLWLVGDILLKADRMSMANSLELRVPFLDKKVFEIAARLPKKFKITKKHTKFALRLASLSMIPLKTANESKLGFPVPIKVWLRQKEYYEKVKKEFQSKVAGEFFNIKEICRLLVRHYQKKCDYSRKIWTIYIFIVWYNIYFGDSVIKEKICKEKLVSKIPKTNA
ncbi:MAG: asparagine synthase (glutamine-hydrolyzing) [Candidatus Improbicoccus devescovinae]|nr:MAG: asparagine synthase (glutamine-hydrolyzing) [Candidatus Improbicoccus devescovinae]